MKHPAASTFHRHHLLCHSRQIGGACNLQHTLEQSYGAVRVQRRQRQSGEQSSEGDAGDAALVLLPTGELREYPRPATAARVLEDCVTADDGGSGSAEWFLCDSDRMGFEGPMAAVDGAEELRPGRIYFVLPAEARRRRGGLRREEVAALAVRASAALAVRAENGRRRRGGAAVAPLVLTPTEEDQEEIVPAARSKAGRRPRRRPFAPDLTAIPECEMGE